MAGLRKRKHASDADQTIKQRSFDIKNFGGVSKSAAADEGSKKRKTTHAREPTRPATTTSRAPTSKRKRGLEAVAEEEEEEKPTTNGSSSANGFFKQFATDSSAVTPRTKRFKNAEPVSPAETPSKSTAALFGSLKIDSSVESIPFALRSKSSTYDTPLLTPDAETQPGYEFPDELQTLLRLHTSFLSALSMYYSHNGTSSPANVAALLPLVTKHWKKRNVTLNDLRLLLGLEQGDGASFTLKDFGMGGVCMVKAQERGRGIKRVASYVDEVGISAGFENALRDRWAQWQTTVGKENQSGAAFVNQLPLADIAEDDSTAKTAPVFARGQQRLADLKAGQAAAKAEESTVTPDVQPQHKTTQAVQSRGTGLLDRILAKQAQASSLPSGPTKAQLERKAALHRIEDVARVLNLLTAGRPRFSLGLPAMAQQLQQSLRNPISREEVQLCLELMANEVTPGFVRLVLNGEMTGVVVVRSGKVEVGDLRRRVQSAIA